MIADSFITLKSVHANYYNFISRKKAITGKMCHKGYVLVTTERYALIS